MVGFCDLVGTDIAPVSKKTAVKAFVSMNKKKSQLLSHYFHSRTTQTFGDLRAILQNSLKRAKQKINFPQMKNVAKKSIKIMNHLAIAQSKIADQTIGKMFLLLMGEVCNFKFIEPYSIIGHCSRISILHGINQRDQ